MLLMISEGSKNPMEELFELNQDSKNYEKAPMTFLL